MIYPDEKTVAYSYDSLNRLITVADWLNNTTSYTYDSAGRLIHTANPNGTTVDYTYDQAGRMTGLTNATSEGTILSQYAYTLDAIGNHIQVEVNEPLLKKLTAQTTLYEHDAENRQTKAGEILNTFDANGNLIARGENRFSYNSQNRLIQSVIDGVMTQYCYDGLGNRLAKTEDGKTTQYVLDINGPLSNVLAEVNENDNSTAYYTYGLGLISQMQPDGTASYYHYDFIGNTIALTDDMEEITDAYTYDPFGNIVNSAGTTINPFKYVGQFGVMDEGNGLTYMRARYYAAEIGRFLNKDILIGNIREPQSLNQYVYGLNNPITSIDPLGLFNFYRDFNLFMHYFVGIGSPLILPFSQMGEDEITLDSFPEYVEAKNRLINSRGTEHIDTRWRTGREGGVGYDFGGLLGPVEFFLVGDLINNGNGLVFYGTIIAHDEFDWNWKWQGERAMALLPAFSAFIEKYSDKLFGEEEAKLIRNILGLNAAEMITRLMWWLGPKFGGHDYSIYSFKVFNGGKYKFPITKK